MKPLPPSVESELMEQQAAMGWPDMVPMFVELPDTRWCCYRSVDVGQCEQLVEHHSRLARLLLEHLHGLAIEPARHILLARLFRCRYIQLTGKQDSTEDDMPFPHNQW